MPEATIEKTTYVATNKCFTKLRYFNEGEEINIPDNAIELCLECHDDDGKRIKSVKYCKSCHNTGRSFPPHHFIVKGEDIPDDPNKYAEEKRKKGLQAKLTDMGVEYRDHWGITKLDSVLRKAITKQEGDKDNEEE